MSDRALSYTVKYVYSKSGVIAYAHFNGATNLSADDKGGQLYSLACLVKVYLKYDAGDLLHFTFQDRYVVNILGRVGLHFLQILSVWQNWFDF